MEKSSINVTGNSSHFQQCIFGSFNFFVLGLIDIVTVLMGQPVIAKLLWIIFTSKRSTDILNCNLALFHNLQYVISILHLFFLFLLPHIHQKILKFLFVYVLMGGPMSLSFICLERYVAVIHPTYYPLLKKYRYRELCAVTVWLFSVPCALAIVFVPDKYSSLTENVMSGFPIVVMLLMTAMIVWCSYCIARALKKSVTGREALHPVKKRALKTVCSTSSIALFCYILVASLERAKSFTNMTNKCIILPLCILLLSVASCVHPLFYLYTQGNFFTCLKCEKKTG